MKPLLSIAAMAREVVTTSCWPVAVGLPVVPPARLEPQVLMVPEVLIAPNAPKEEVPDW